MKELIAGGAMALGGILLIAAIIAFFMALPAFLAMLAWNWLAPTFWTAAPILSFWQAWVALFLLGIVGKMLRPSVEVKK